MKWLGILFLMLGVSTTFVLAGPQARLQISHDSVEVGQKIYFDASQSQSSRGTDTGIKFRWKFRQVLNWSRYQPWPWIAYIPRYGGTEVVWLEVMDTRTGETDRTYKTYQVKGNTDNREYRDWEENFRGGIPRQNRKDYGRSRPSFAYSPQFSINFDLNGRGDFEVLNDRLYEMTEGGKVQFSAKSETLNGQSISGALYRFDFEGDRRWDTDFTSNSRAEFSFQEDGTYYPIVEAVLPSGERSYAWVRLEVENNTRAQVRILTPEQIVAGEKIEIRLDINDAQTEADDFLIRIDADSDGNFETGYTRDETIEWIYFTPGEQEIVVEIRDPQGEVSEYKKQILVSEIAPIDVHVKVSNKTLPVGARFRFVVSEANQPNLNYRWRVREVFGSQTYSGTQFSVYFNTPGQKLVELDVYNEAGDLKLVRIPVWVQNPGQVSNSPKSLGLVAADPIQTPMSATGDNQRVSNAFGAGSLSEILEDITTGNATEVNLNNVQANQGTSGLFTGADLNGFSRPNFIGPYGMNIIDDPEVVGKDETVELPPGTPVDAAYRPLYDASTDPLGDYDGPLRPGGGPWIDE